MKKRRCNGFTLLELLLVMVVLGIVMGMAGFTFGRDPQRVANQEASLFLQLLQHARHQAVLEGVTLGIRIDAQGYQLLKTVEHSWEAAGKQRETGLDIRMEIEGVPVPLAQPGRAPQLVIDPYDEYTPFSLHFEADSARLVSLSSDGLNDPQFVR